MEVQNLDGFWNDVVDGKRLAVDMHFISNVIGPFIESLRSRIVIQRNEDF